MKLYTPDRRVPLKVWLLGGLLVLAAAFWVGRQHWRPGTGGWWAFDTAGIHSFTLKTWDGGKVPLSRYKGKALLVALIDSPEAMGQIYPRLNRLVDRYQSRGFEVLAVPVARFHDRLPDDRWIRTQTSRFGARFLVPAKISARDGSLDPFYWFLSREFEGVRGGGLHGWAHDKLLFAPDGTALGQYMIQTPPDHESILEDIEEALPENWAVPERRMKMVQKRKMRNASVPLVPDVAGGASS